MEAEHNSQRVHSRHHRSERCQSPHRGDRHRDWDREDHRSNSLRKRSSVSRLIHEDGRTQSQNFDRNDDRRFLESASRRLSESQSPHPSALLAPADPPDSCQNVVVPNQSKIYIGGLPEFTRLEDLHDCFSQLGRIKNVEQKSGYAFVEYDNPQSACDAVAKYHEGTFLGSQIKVEISHGGSRPRHVAVSNNPEACYTCGVTGHWARDCPDADSQKYHKRRLHPRSRSPPRGRDDDYHHRDSRHQLEVASYENPPHRRSPLGQINFMRDGHEKLAASQRERYSPPAFAEAKRYRPDNSFNDRERDHRRPDLKASAHPDHRDSQKMLPSLSRTASLNARDYHLNERSRYPDPYLSRSPPSIRDNQNDWTHEAKSDFSKSSYQRNLTRAHEPVRLGGYDARYYYDERVPYDVERMAGSNLIDARYQIPDARFPRWNSPRRLRSPRRSLSPPSRTSNYYRNSYRAQSPPGPRSGYNSGPGGHIKASYPLRR